MKQAAGFVGFLAEHASLHHKGENKLHQALIVFLRPDVIAHMPVLGKGPTS